MYQCVVDLEVLKDRLHYHRIVLQHYTECQYGLLEQLKSRQVFTSKQLTDIVCLNNFPNEQIKKLFELVAVLQDKKQFEELCNSFIDTKQSHLVPYLTAYHSKLYKLLTIYEFIKVSNEAEGIRCTHNILYYLIYYKQTY